MSRLTATFNQNDKIRNATATTTYDMIFFSGQVRSHKIQIYSHMIRRKSVLGD